VSLGTDEYQIHDATNALKRFLRNLEDPLMTQRLSPQWKQAAGIHKFTCLLIGFGFVLYVLGLCCVYQYLHFTKVNQ